MKPAKIVKISLGILTFYQPVHFILFFTYLATDFLSTAFPLLHLFLVVLFLALIVVYFAHIHGNANLDKDDKKEWMILVFLFWPIVEPIYWFQYIWREKAKTICNQQPDVTNEP